MHGNKGCLQQRKNMGLILKTPLAVLDMQMHQKSPFYENISDLTLFSQTWDFFSCFFLFGFIFFRTLTPVILFPETLLAAPILF